MILLIKQLKNITIINTTVIITFVLFEIVNILSFIIQLLILTKITLFLIPGAHKIEILF
jgi:F0F1-type ATP synthase membrane subunit c/vacuolar-type H+-ATPase subunit K